VNLVRNDAVKGFRETVASAYKDRLGITPEVYACQTADGARELI
jgi:galactokinase